jgi:hypothetical protein
LVVGFSAVETGGGSSSSLIGVHSVGTVGRKRTGCTRRAADFAG